MKYDPTKHHRRSIRLKGYDYARAGAYFVTICVQNRECLLGEVTGGEMRVNEWGHIMAACWNEIPAHFPDVALDVSVVMPNHIHGIVILRGAGKGETSAETSLEPTEDLSADASPLRPHGTQPGSLGAIVQNFKSVSTRRINAFRHLPGARLWQRNYWEHIIRSENALFAIRRYIQQNPLKWTLDRDNPQNSRKLPPPARNEDYLSDIVW